jgi:ankyrin repeat protein
MIHNTKEDIYAMKGFLRKRNVDSINNLIKRKKFNVNAPLSGSRCLILFHFIQMIIIHQDKPIGDVEFKIVKLIVESKADINYINDGFNVLTIIHKFNRDIDETKNIIKLLLDNKANNYDSELKQSALDYAVKSKNLQSIRLLLENGVVPNETIFGRYKNHFYYDNLLITKLLLEYMPSEFLFKSTINDKKLLVRTCNLGCLTATKQIIKNEIDINQTYISSLFFERHTVVFCATLIKIVMRNIRGFKKSNDDIRKNILGDGKDLSNYIEIAKLLIDYGIDTTDVKLNKTIRSYVIERKNTLVEYLLNHVPKVLAILITSYL